MDEESDSSTEWWFRSFEAFPSKNVSSGQQSDSNTDDLCGVCLASLAGGEPLVSRSVSTCIHRTHVECMYFWKYAGNSSCPICRASLR
jgi:hypothetical protein